MKAEEYYPGSHLQSLFNFFSNEHDLVLTEGQMQDIINEVKSLSSKEEEEKYPTKEVCFFELKFGRYLAENGEEITTEMLMNHQHALFHDNGYIIF